MGRQRRNDTTMSVTRVCFVCLGNICRSPLAEGIFKHQVAQAGLADEFHVESAGIEPWHVGEAPDPRAQETARAHGLRLAGRAQQFKARDLDRFDLVLALDAEVLEHLRRLAPASAAHAKVRALRETDPTLSAHGTRSALELEVPDPYYGGPEGFELAYQMIERSTRQLLENLRHLG